MKILALSVGDPTVASTQFRLGQFVESLSSQNITLEIVPASHPDLWPDLTSYDIIIIQKKLLRLSLVRKVRRESKCLIYDTDDAIWEPHAKKHFVLTRLRSRARLKAVLAAADLCTVPNEQLGNYLRPLTKKVALIPMALDPRSWSPPAKRECGPLRIGWTGAPPNLIYLTALEDTLVRIQHDFPEAELVIYCGQKPSWNQPVKSVHHKFSPGAEHQVVQNFDIGLLPLPSDLFAAGKSPIKGVQYAACGIPCIASPIGATCEIVKDGVTGLTANTPTEWEAALRKLISDPDFREAISENARAHFLKHHSKDEVEKKLIAMWEEAIASKN